MPLAARQPWDARPRDGPPPEGTVTLLRDLGFRTKMLLVPATATVALVGGLVVAEALGAASQRTLSHLERSLVPALEASRDLQDIEAELERALQDAIAAEDPKPLADADRLRARFRESLRALEDDDDGRAESRSLAQAYDAAWAAAREASARAIAGSPSDELREKASRRVAALRDDLAAQVRRERAELAQGFEHALKLQRATSLAMLVGTGAVVLILALLARWIARGVAGPVVVLSRAAKRVAEGDLTPGPVAVASRDELGELARSFAAMVERLRALPLALTETVGDLGRAVTEAEAASIQQGAALERQVVALARSRATAERILRETQETSRRADMVLKTASQVEAYGDAAQLAARESVTGLGEISDQVKQVTGGIAQVAQHTQTIGGLVATMKRLGVESSELALSVSVEAARAGAGGGPLADASRLLKDLATRSAQTSVRVTRALAEAEGAIEGVSAISEESKRRMGKGLDQVRSSGESLREITAVVRKSGKAARAIVASVSEQGNAIAEITSDVLALDEATTEALKGSRRAQASADSLKRAAGRLATVVQSFKV
jgi:methyl-accepting chemotaxis protein